MAMSAAAPAAESKAEADALGVKIEAEYTVGEYDIVILSAKESLGLQTWLQLNGYKIPVGADRALEPYIRSDMKFFVAKVNLAEHQRTGLHVSAAAAVRFRIAEVHAADSARHD